MASMFKASCSSSSSSSSSSSPSSSMLQSEKDQVKYKGVRLRKWGKWVSEIRLPNSRERIWLGSYDSAEKAARAFDAAQFCLRGRNAKFNFADNPPSINNLVGGRSSLTPAEIQEVASRHANNCDDHDHELQAQGNNTNTGAKVDDDHHHFGSHQTLMELDYTSPISSIYSDGAFKMETVDWSFYDMIETNNGVEAAAAAAPGITSHNMNIPDYGLMFNSLDHLHEDMYMNPHLGTNINDHHQNATQDDDQQNVDEHYSHHQSFLWNF